MAACRNTITCVLLTFSLEPEHGLWSSLLIMYSSWFVGEASNVFDVFSHMMKTESVEISVAAWLSQPMSMGSQMTNQVYFYFRFFPSSASLIHIWYNPWLNIHFLLQTFSCTKSLIDWIIWGFKPLCIRTCSPLWQRDM